MRNRFISKVTLAALLAICSLSAFGQNTAKVGSLTNGVATVTDQAEATRVLKGGLSATASISNISIEYCAGDQSYYLVGQVSNDPVTGKGVQLHAKGTGLYAVVGPGVEITCMGDNCKSCMPDLKGFRPICNCFVAGDGPGPVKCDMYSKVTIGF